MLPDVVYKQQDPEHLQKLYALDRKGNIPVEHTVSTDRKPDIQQQTTHPC